ncbi:hypothetical protein [Spiroplasma kunkelii]|nr:hypothetical protein [Spiroplasma kunkelii]
MKVTEKIAEILLISFSFKTLIGQILPLYNLVFHARGNPPIPVS